MNMQEYANIAGAARLCGVVETTLHYAIGRGEVPTYLTASGKPMVLVKDVRKWKAQVRRRGPKPKAKA